MPSIGAKFPFPPSTPIPFNPFQTLAQISQCSPFNMAIQPHSKSQIQISLLSRSISESCITAAAAAESDAPAVRQSTPTATTTTLTTATTSIAPSYKQWSAQSRFIITNHLQQQQHLIKRLNIDAINYILMIICLQMIPYVLIYCIEECSPLVLFSWWRNKIS